MQSILIRKGLVFAISIILIISAFSITVSADTSPPVSPINLVADNPSTNSIDLSWTKGYMNGTHVHNIIYVDNFTKYAGNPIIDGSAYDWCDYGIRDPFLLVNKTGYAVKEDGKYVMYFNGRDTPTYITRIGRANSTDGISWTLNDSYVFNDTESGGYTSVGSVIKRDTNDYIMYYVNDSGTSSINYATSTDGIEWTASRTGYLLNESDWTDCDGVRLPYVTYINGEWHMVVEAVDVSDGEFHIYYANSSDGLNWAALGDPIYTGGADGSWDDDGQANPQLLELEDGKYVIFYNGRPDITPWNLGVLNSTSIASGWGEWTGNPVLEVGGSGEWDDTRIEGMRVLRDDVGKSSIRMWYFGLPTTNSYADGCIGYAICNETFINTVVRYSTSNNLSTYTDGSLAYNGTATNITLTGLSSGTTYYFRAWNWNSSAGWNVTGSNTVSLATVSTGGWVHNIDTGLNYSTIQAAIDATDTNSGHTILVDPGIYTENVDVYKSLTIRSTSGNPEDTVVQANNSNDHVFEVTTDHVNISGFTVQYANASSMAGIYLTDVDYCNLFDNNLTNSYNGIYLSWSNNNAIVNNLANINHKYGVYLYWSSDNTIANNTINSNGHDGIYLLRSDDNTVVNNTANLNVVDNIFLNGSSSNTVVNNKVADSILWGIYIAQSSIGNTIANNVAMNNTLGGIWLQAGANSNTIVNNTAVNSTYGIWIKQSSSNIILNNTATNNNYSIYLNYADSNTFSNNTVNSNNNAGFFLYFSDSNTISNNAVNSNNIYGVALRGSSSNTIVNNTATNHTYGIWGRVGSNNTIANNTATNNTYGIYLYQSSNSNTIYNNYFNNTNNAWGDGDNIWNITKTVGGNIVGGTYLGGNYWSDYNGTDTDGDGLGNTNLPHNCFGDIQNGGDWLPLVLIFSDAIPPEITNVDANPDPQEDGGYVNITCDVTDNVGVDEVWVNITYPDSSYHNQTMLGGSYYYNTSYTISGTYDYFIWANDTSGNSNTSSGHSFDIQVMAPPEIVNVVASPDPQLTGGYVNITCDVTDNVGVDEVFLNITYPDSSFENFSISENKTSNSYYCNRSYADVGVYNYSIWANDINGNSDTSSVYDFVIQQDNIPPQINNVIDTPDPQEAGGYVNITCDVTDNVGVDEVWVNLTYPDSSYHNQTMLGGSYYYNTSYAISGTYGYFIWANDINGNSNTSSVYDFVIQQDNIPPQINNVIDTPDPQEAGGYVNITCDVTDNVGVDEVWVNITYPDDEIHNFSMNIGSYYYNQNYSTLGNYTYFIWANDTNGNSNTSSPYQFTIIDNSAPLIFDNSDDITRAGEYFVVNATVTDDDSVDGVWIEYWFDGGSRTNESMTQVVATDYYEKTIIIPGGYTNDLWYNISANDTYGVWSHLNSQQVVVIYINTSVDDISSSYNQTSSPLTINVTSYGDSVVNVTLYYRYSTDNISWGVETYNFGVPNSEFMNPTGHGDEYDCVAYSSDRNSVRDYFSPDYSGTAQDITIRYYYGSGSDSKMKCALYYLNETFIAETEEKTLPSGSGYGNVTFNFIGDRPEVFSDETYILAQWFDETGADYTFIDCRPDNSRFNYGDAEDYDNGVFPEPLDDDDHNLWNGWSLAIICHYAVGTSWVEWNDTSNPDTSSPWQWSFDFPNGTGYYEFYSIGKTSDFSEYAPVSADAICYFYEDTILPEIANVDASPDPQLTGGYVNITCDVTDNVGVDEVFLNITYPDSSYHNFSMYEGSYYYNATYTIPGTYDYFIWANDTSGNSDTSSIYSFFIIRWNVGLDISASNGKHDILVFGEVDDASDGQDNYDAPKPGAPPSPYVYAWFDANLSGPYDRLWEDYRGYPDTYKVWDMYIEYENASAGNITISWNSSSLNGSEYGSVLLNDINSSIGTDMFSNSNYTFAASPGSVRHFQIICSALVEYTYNVSLGEGWNLVSLPVNQSVHKDNITVSYLGVNYTWQQAVDNGTILRFIYGWNTTNQNYVYTEILDPGKGYWMYAYYECDLLISSNTSNNDNHITNLQEEWNLIGLPYDTLVAKEDLTVYYNGTEYTWQQAVDNGTILRFIYGWNTTNQNYVYTEILDPGKGYWMYAYYNCTLLRPTS